MGGTSGISILAATLLPHMDVGTFMFIINAVLVALGLVFLGPKTMGATIYSSFALFFMYGYWSASTPCLRLYGRHVSGAVLCVVLLPAAGSAIVFNIGVQRRHGYFGHDPFKKNEP